MVHASKMNKSAKKPENKSKLLDLELDFYRKIGEVDVTKSNLTSELGLLMDIVLNLLEAESATLYLLDKLNNELIFEVVKGPAYKKIRGIRIRSDQGIAGYVVDTGKPYISNDLEKDKLWLRLKTGYEQRNMMAVPLKVKRNPIGVIEVINKAKGENFSKADLKTLTHVASHFCRLIDRMNLCVELKDRVRQFSTLNEVGNILVSSLDHKVIGQQAIEAITKLMYAEAGSLLLVDRDSNELYFEVATGEKGEKVKTVRLKMGEGIAGWVAKHGKPLLIPDVTKDKRFQSRVDTKSKFETKNMVCVPLKIKGKVLGVIQAMHRKTGTFNKNDLELFQLFSNHVAIALENANLYEEIRETLYTTVEALAEAIEKRDPYTGGHTKRVLNYSLTIAKQLKVPDELYETLKLSAILHDIGKIAIDDKILRKNTSLDENEFEMMRQHPKFGAEILKHVKMLKDTIPGMLHHHERIDGNGYPLGLRDNEIPLIAKIIAVADTYDAMSSTRPYRDRLHQEVVLEELRNCAGTQFDPEVVNAFLKAYDNGEIEIAVDAANEFV